MGAASHIVGPSGSGKGDTMIRPGPPLVYCGPPSPWTRLVPGDIVRYLSSTLDGGVRHLTVQRIRDGVVEAGRVEDFGPDHLTHGRKPV